MEFYAIIGSLLSTFERKVYKLAKIHPIINDEQNDIETGLYYGENIDEECRLTIYYNSDEECKWADDQEYI